MWFFFESAESKRKKRELEEENKRIEEEKIRKETIINSIPIYFTSVVDFEYKILSGSVYSWVTGQENFDEALKFIFHDLKNSAYYYGADCLIDVKFNVSQVRVAGWPTTYVVHATGIAVKRLD